MIIKLLGHCRLILNWWPIIKEHQFSVRDNYNHNRKKKLNCYQGQNYNGVVACANTWNFFFIMLSLCYSLMFKANGLPNYVTPNKTIRCSNDWSNCLILQEYASLSNVYFKNGSYGNSNESGKGMAVFCGNMAASEGGGIKSADDRYIHKNN